MLKRTPKVIRLTALVLAVGLIAPSNRVGAQEGRQNGMLQAGEAPRLQVDLGEIKPSDTSMMRTTKLGAQACATSAGAGSP